MVMQLQDAVVSRKCELVAKHPKYSLMTGGRESVTFCNGQKCFASYKPSLPRAIFQGPMVK